MLLLVPPKSRIPTTRRLSSFFLFGPSGVRSAFFLSPHGPSHKIFVCWLLSSFDFLVWFCWLIFTSNPHPARPFDDNHRLANGATRLYHRRRKTMRWPVQKKNNAQTNGLTIQLMLRFSHAPPPLLIPIPPVTFVVISLPHKELGVNPNDSLRFPLYMAVP